MKPELNRIKTFTVHSAASYFAAFFLALFSVFGSAGNSNAAILKSADFESQGPCYGMSCMDGGRVLNPSGGCANHIWQSGEQWCQEEVLGGGWNNTRGVRLYIRQNMDQFDFGWYFGTGKSWQVGDTAVWRFRIKYDSNFRWDGSGSQQNKITNQGPSGNRFVIHNERGSWTADYCTPLDAASGGTYGPNDGSIAVKAGIADPCAGPVKITYGQWYHVQIAIKSGTNNTAALKIWVNNNDMNNPSAQNTGLNFGVTNWNDSWNFGGFWTDENSLRSQGWIVDDLQIADTLDPGWYPGTQPDTTPPAAPTGLAVR